MFNYCFKKAFLLFLCIGILPSAYAMQYRQTTFLERTEDIAKIVVPTFAINLAIYTFAPDLFKKINQYDYTPRGSFQRAEKNGCFSPESLQAIEQSLEKGFINPHFTIGFGQNITAPLMVAVQCQEPKIVDLLLKRNVNPNFCNKQGDSPLSIAIDNILEKSDTGQKQKVNYGILKKLLQNNANVIGNSNELLVKAVINQNPNLVNLLLELKVNPNVFNNDGNVLSLTINNIFQEKNIQKQEDNYQILKDLLDHGAEHDCNFSTSGSTPLIAAITNKNARIVNLLLKYNADVNGYDYIKHRKTPLSIVIDNILQEKNDQKQKINYVILKDLLTHEVNINSVIWEFGTTALLRAVFNKNLKLIDVLLENKADVNISNSGHTAAYYMIDDILREKDAKKQETNYEILKKLLKYGAKCDFLVDCNELPLIVAIKNQDIMLINFLLEHIDTNGINACSKDGKTALSVACKTGDLKTVKKLLDNKANPNIKIGKKTSLIWAIENENLEIIELLLQYGADVTIADKKGNTPLYFAYKLNKNSKEFNNNKLIINLLKRGANPNIKLKYDQTPLTIAVSDQDFEMVELLLKHKADINTSAYGDTPLSTAVERALETGNNQIVEYLLKQGADPNFINVNDKHTEIPFVMAIQRQNLDMIKLLLKHKANINAPYYCGGTETPLFIAVATNNLEIVKYLLEHGANPNMKNRNSLVKAIQHQNLDMFKLLLQYQTDVNDFCYQNTPLSAAIENDNLEAVKILCRAGASLILDNGTNIFDLLKNKSQDLYIEVITQAYFDQEFHQKYNDPIREAIELLLIFKKGEKENQQPNLSKDLHNLILSILHQDDPEVFKKKISRELLVITSRDPILNQVNNSIKHLLYILKQSKNPILLHGLDLENDFNILITAFFDLQKSNIKLSSAELISLLDQKLPNNLALGIYKNYALLENEKQKN